MPVTAPLLDNLLQPWFDASDEAQAQGLLSELVRAHVAPVVARIIRGKLQLDFIGAGHPSNHPAAEDVYGETIAQLLTELHKLKTQPAAQPIQNLSGYVAQLAFNACYQYLREQQPQRHKLKNRLRYLLTRQPGFDLWQGARGELWCGYAKWRGQERGGTNWQALSAEPGQWGEWLARALPQTDAATMPPVALLKALFDGGGGAVELDTLVNIVAELWGVSDHLASLDADAPTRRAPYQQTPDNRVDVAASVSDRLYLQRLWEEVVALPVRQRAALLLSLRDAQGNGITALLPAQGIVSLSGIAVTLELEPRQFAELWNDLPLADDRIAALFGLTRQQVINLRKSARERLARRMAAL